MKFDRLVSLLLESEEISKNIKNKNPNEVWKVAQDIRKNIQDYPDLNLASVYANMEVDYPPYINRSKMNNDVYIPIEDKFYRISISDFATFARKKQRDEKHITPINAIGYVRHVRNQAHSASQMQKVAELYKMRRSEQEIEEETVAIKKWERTKKPLSKDEKENVMSFYKIGTPEIYRYLLETTYDRPKHPAEMPNEFRHLPRLLLNELLYNKKTPVDLAIESSRQTNHQMGTFKGVEFNMTGNVRILDYETHRNTNLIPSRKEAMKWLGDLSDYMIPENEYDVHSRYNLKNFPSWLIEESGIGNHWHREIDLSFQSWLTFRWFVHNINSKFFYRPIVQHIQGRRVEILPLDQVSHILDADLVNGVKTSPENAFRNASDREAKDFHESNKDKQFNSAYGREYQDTKNAKVVQNVAALKKEGQRMNHCVGGYGPSCLSGRSLIISLPNSTAELNPKTLDVYQHRGYGNDSPPPKDEIDLQEWIALNSK